MKRLTQFATFFVLAASLRADLVGSLTVTGAEGSDSIAVGGSVRCPGTSVICDGSSDSLVIVVHTFGLSIDGGAGATYGTSYLDFSGISFAGNLPLWQFTVSYAAVNGFTPQDVTLNNGVLAVDLSGGSQVAVHGHPQVSQHVSGGAAGNFL